MSGRLPREKQVTRNERWSGVPQAQYDLESAIKVNFSIAVMEIPSIDVVAEQFEAIFSMHLYWVDPSLRSFKTTIGYIDEETKQYITSKNVVVKECSRYSEDGTWKVALRPRDDLPGKEKRIKPTHLQYMAQPDWTDGKNGYFLPKFTIGNAAEEPEKLDESINLEYCNDSGGHVFQKIKFKVKLYESLELQEMPFDKQVLRIIVYGEHPLWRMQLCPLVDEGFKKEFRESQQEGKIPIGPGSRAGYVGVRKSNRIPSEWKLPGEDRPEYGKAWVVLNDALGKQRVPHCRALAWSPGERDFRSTVYVLIHVVRKANFYVWNVMLVNFLISTTTLTAYAEVIENVEGRAGILFTILLTSVGYKYICTTYMPVKSYLTYMDKYILLNFVFQLIQIAQIFISARFLCQIISDDDEDWQDGRYSGAYTNRQPPSHQCAPYVHEVEGMFLSILFGSWIVLHVLGFMIFNSASLFNRLDRYLRIISTWEEVYRDNDLYVYDEKDGPRTGCCVIDEFDTFPYGERPPRPESRGAAAAVEDGPKPQDGTDPSRETTAVAESKPHDGAEPACAVGQRGDGQESPRERPASI